MKTTIDLKYEHNQFGYKQILFFIFCVININAMAVYQMRNWTLPPNKVKMQWGSAPVVSTLPGSSTAQYKAANGVYDENDNLLFYVADGDIRNAAGVSLASLGSNTLKEVVLVPVPGTCRQYYVIIARAIPLATIELYSAIVNCSSGTAVVSSNWSVFATQIGNGCGLAATKIISGEGSAAIRYLYAVSASQLKRYTISNTGIGSVLDMSSGGVNTLSNSQCMPTEAELNFDGSKFAWGSTSAADSKIYEVSTASPYTLNTYTLSPTPKDQQISGLEYDGSNNLWVSARSVTPTSNGIYKITTGVTPVYTPLSGTSNFNNTQLELSIYGNILAVNNSGTFGYIDPASNSFSTTALNIPIVLNSNLNASPLPGAAYSLPDQIDNENYAYFNGINEAQPSFQINGTNSTNLCPNPMQVYNCVPIAVNNTSTFATSYVLQVQSLDANCNLISGAGYLNYNSGTITSLPTDLRAMPGTNGTWLATNTGRFRITITASNGCSTKSTVATLQVNGTPNAVTSCFKFRNSSSCNVPGVSGGANCASAISVCANSPKISGDCSGGQFVNGTYDLVVDEYSACGTFVKNVINSTVNPLNSTADLVCLSLNDFTTGFNYFSTNPVGYRYSVSLTIRNVCSVSTSTSWFIDNFGGCKTDDEELTTAIDDKSFSVTNEIISLYPNPSNGNATIEFSTISNEQISLAILDMQGRVVLDVISDTNYPLGLNKINVPTASLASGAYTYLLHIGTSSHRGKFVKSAD